MKKQRVIKFEIHGARWFDKVNGNTYHSVSINILKTGKVIKVPFQYGYGDHYRQSALEILAGLGLLGKKYTKENAYLYERGNNYPIVWSVTDGLKRDCIANGQFKRV